VYSQKSGQNEPETENPDSKGFETGQRNTRNLALLQNTTIPDARHCKMQSDQGLLFDSKHGENEKLRMIILSSWIGRLSEPSQFTHSQRNIRGEFTGSPA
jgi:hypothetical protein